MTKSASIFFITGLTLLLSSAPVSADTVTFAQFTEAGGGGNDFNFVSSTNSATFSSRNPKTGSSIVPVYFDFLSFAATDLPLDLQGPQAAQLTFSVTTTQNAVTFGNFFDQNLYSQSASGVPNYGTIKFTRDTPDHELGQTNLLTVSFWATAGGLDGIRKGQTATLSADNGQTDYVQFSSSYLNFDPQSDENLALSFTSATPCFTVYANVKSAKGGCTQTSSAVLNFLHSFTAAGTGTFASDPSPTSVFAVPEPGTNWLTLLGATGIGMLLLRRSRRSPVAEVSK
ncbi:MAG TPA: PEP-CTERM sorting domain-containing protein [Bryobacteraceae bacterium]|nr:PEP-CTERM sorting domain-containing protein [Bryobacteraceae bacterium]